MSIKHIALIVGFVSCALVAPVYGADSMDTTTLFNPVQNTINVDTPVQSISALIINTLFGIAGSIALVMFVVGGFMWLTSMGNEKQVARGKDIFQWTTLGVIVMFASYTLVSFLFISVTTPPTASDKSSGGSGGGSAASGSSSGGGGTTTSKLYCCVDTAAFTAGTVASAAACSGTNKVAVEGSCDDKRFCGKEFTTTPASATCLPIPKTDKDFCPIGANTYDYYAQCVSSEGLKPKSDYCCYRSKGGGAPEDISVTSNPAGVCEGLGYDTFVSGKCSSITKWCLFDAGGYATKDDYCIALDPKMDASICESEPFSSYNLCASALLK